MGEVKIFECEVTGDRFGAKNDVIEFDIVRRRDNGWDTWSRTCHISNEALEENKLYGRFNLGRFTRLFVEREDGESKIVAAECSRRRTDGSGTYKEFTKRDDVLVADWDERFFQFVEEEVLY